MWPRDGDTQELIREAAKGDRGAVDTLLARHREPLRRMVHLRLDPALAQRLDASDIVQEVLLDASERMREYATQVPMPFHLWLRRIALDRLIDAHRRHRVAKKRSVDRERSLNRGAHEHRSSIELVLALRDSQPTPAAAAMREELARRFRAALELLADGDREVLLMRYFEQLSNSEVAVQLGLSEAAAGMRHLRALRRLKETLVEGL